ncbi:energy transducer TonB family protein [Pseudomonas aeruginosa]|uniref:energy transducer TonB family protein n=1 Tax=Pseudomonas aeruginosa TaxID=287 RepID=UPI000EB5F40E|nr:energy transducer TonB [Pseudomonas aeruginosa]
MDQQQSTDNLSKAKSFLQAKWFPGAIASLALVISIGGHTFTAFNSVALATMMNNISNLEAFRSVTERADGSQDHALQALQGELTRQQRTILALQGELKELRAQKVEPKSDSTMPAGYEAVNEEARRQESAAKAEQQPLKNGVNDRFDSLVRDRMKQHWEAPPVRPGSEHVDDEDTVVLQFAVDRQGWITDVQVANSSGVVEFDNSAVKAALRMNAIPEIARLSDQAYLQIKAFRLAISPPHMK